MTGGALVGVTPTGEVPDRLEAERLRGVGGRAVGIDSDGGVAVGIVGDRGGAVVPDAERLAEDRLDAVWRDDVRRDFF